MVKLISTIIALGCAISSCVASPVLTERAVSATCPRYTIINTRGTGEIQGQSSGFTTINSRITSQLSGGQIYNTVYAADFSQNSAAGTADIVRKVTSTLASDPTHCFYLEGYSQGAAATVNALERLTGASFNAVKGVFLIGNPEHKSGLACNVDTNGGTSTKFVNGLSVYAGGIPSTWVSKTLDVCNYVSSNYTIPAVSARLITNTFRYAGRRCLRHYSRIRYQRRPSRLPQLHRYPDSGIQLRHQAARLDDEALAQKTLSDVTKHPRASGVERRRQYFWGLWKSEDRFCQ